MPDQKQSLGTHVSLYECRTGTYFGWLLMGEIDLDLGFKVVARDVAHLVCDGLPQDPFTLRRNFAIQVSRDGERIKLEPSEYRLFANLLYAPVVKCYREYRSKDRSRWHRLVDLLKKQVDEEVVVITTTDVSESNFDEALCRILTRPKFGTGRRFIA